jgi:hypothetical protein
MRICLTLTCLLFIGAFSISNAQAHSRICVGDGLQYQSEEAEKGTVRPGQIVYQHAIWFNDSLAEHYINRSGEIVQPAKYRIEFDDSTKKIKEMKGDNIRGSVLFSIKMRVTRPDGGYVRNGDSQIVVKMRCRDSWD